MSAGTGVQHSEANESKTDPVTLFQVWVFPKERNIKPRYDQRNFDEEGRLNNWQVVVSPQESDNALWINQDARFALTKLDAGKTIDYKNAFAGNGVYLVVINGSVEVDNEVLQMRDAVGISGTDVFSIKALEDAELLAIEIPMN
jgi:redox-sensitive bicupin YhaK (pirin superfamily)